MGGDAHVRSHVSPRMNCTYWAYHPPRGHQLQLAIVIIVINIIIVVIIFVVIRTIKTPTGIISLKSLAQFLFWLLIYSITNLLNLVVKSMKF